MKHKIAVVTICKNEEQFLTRWYNSAKEADYLAILDTGSSDNTINKAKELGIHVFEKTFTPWRFDTSRNYLLDCLPDDIDYIINLDADEVLVPGWREALDAVSPDVTRPRYKYVWSWNADGSEGLVYSGDKIVRRNGYRWKHPVHEVMVLQEGFAERQEFVDGLVIHHFPDNTKSRGQYLPLLEIAVEEDPMDDRNTYYLAREYFYHQEFEKATEMFKRHLALPTALWAPERAWSMRHLAMMNANEAEKWLLQACAEYPHGREPWVDLAGYYYRHNAWEGCLYAATRALDIQTKPMLYLNESYAWGYMPHDYAAIAAYNLGKYKDAVIHAMNALSHAPDDQRLRSNLFFCRSITSKVDVVIPFKYYLSGLVNLVYQLSQDKKVNKVIIVCDGQEAYESVEGFPFSGNVITTMVPSGIGIHRMWNLGMQLSEKDNHIAFINDDVSLGDNCMTTLSDALDANLGVGLVCPNYSDKQMLEDVVSTTTCRGRYDGEGGIAGFCFVLSKDCKNGWRFDERMRWWYGDDDIVNWVNLIENKQSVIVANASCKHEHSATINTFPPDNFTAIVEKDRVVFENKWSEKEIAFMREIKNRFPQDIIEHLDTITKYASQAEIVTEFGTRYGVSTLALLRGNPKSVVSVDLNKKFFDRFESSTNSFAELCGVDFTFIEADDLKIDIEPTDLLFIDTWHTYAQLSAELKRHAKNVNRWIILHDTVSFGDKDETAYSDAKVSKKVKSSTKQGLNAAVKEFLNSNKDWFMVEHYENNNGLTILEKR